jgi:hypothetical protein
MMTPASQSSNGSSSATTPPLDRAKALASTLLSERGEASGALLARELHGVLDALDAGERHGFQRYLATEFQSDAAALRIAAERYLADTTAEAVAALAQADAEGFLHEAFAQGGTIARSPNVEALMQGPDRTRDLLEPARPFRAIKTAPHLSGSKEATS